MCYCDVAKIINVEDSVPFENHHEARSNGASGRNQLESDKIRRTEMAHLAFSEDLGYRLLALFYRDQTAILLKPIRLRLHVADSERLS